jgi:hypothetical protein
MQVETEAVNSVGAPKLKAPSLDKDLLPFSLRGQPRVELVEPPVTRNSLKGLDAFTWGGALLL